jgi:hypothetical protein
MHDHITHAGEDSGRAAIKADLEHVGTASKEGMVGTWSR